nr:hypothetical protein [Tanacetum cinerariifolium]
MSNNIKFVEYSENEVSSLTFFNNFGSKTAAKAPSSSPTDKEEGPSGEENLSEGNVGTHLEKPIGSKWVFRIKYKCNGEIERYKARLVAKDFGQKVGINYEETFSLVVKMETVRKYCLELLHDFGLLACKLVMTPLPENIILAHKKSDNDNYLNMHSPLKSHIDIALKVLKYLKLAPDYGIEFSKRESSFDIAAFSDADWAKCPVTKSLYCDNKSAIQITANHVMHEKTKHFDLDVHLVRENVSSGLIKTIKVDSKENVADKALGSF